MRLVLRCPSAPELRLGPDSNIRFRNGQAVVDFNAGQLELLVRWLDHEGTPPVDILAADGLPIFGPLSSGRPKIAGPSGWAPVYQP